MLRLLLDEHLSPRIVHQFRARWPDAQIDSVLDWEGGRLSGVPDDLLLTQAHAHGWTLVTYDQATIVPLLKNWAEQGIPHSGVILVDGRTIASNDIGGLLRALGTLWDREKNSDWRNTVFYLVRS
jgi:hypothetical protein